MTMKKIDKELLNIVLKELTADDSLEQTKVFIDKVNRLLSILTILFLLEVIDKEDYYIVKKSIEQLSGISTPKCIAVSLSNVFALILDVYDVKTYFLNKKKLTINGINAYEHLNKILNLLF